MPTKTALVLDDRPLLILPKLAAAIGLDQAVVIQQLHYLLSNPANGRSIRGRRWIFNTYTQWRAQYFPFWSERTIRRAFNSLEKIGVVSTCQPDGNTSRRKYYRVNEGALRRMMGTISEVAILAASNRPDGPHPLTKTSPINNLSEESEETASGEAAQVIGEKEYPATWKPDKRTKEQKLRTVRVPENYPSEREFDAFLEENDCVAQEYRTDLYDKFSTEKWHQWNQEHQKWVRIRDWKAYVLALDEKIAERPF